MNYLFLIAPTEVLATRNFLTSNMTKKKQRFLQVINILKKQKLRTEMREASLTAAIIRK